MFANLYFRRFGKVFAVIGLIIVSVHIFLSYCSDSATKVNDTSTIRDSSMSFDINFVEKNFNMLDQTDPKLIHYTRIKFINPPSTLPYNLNQKNTERMKTELSAWVLQLLGDKHDGIFIEAGANDGEYHSNTLHLENLGWTGLLIECNPTLVPEILTKHRKAWVADVCLSPGPKAGTFKFKFPTHKTGLGVFVTDGKPLDDYDAAHPANKFFDVSAVPLGTILEAVGLKEIDYFSFDIEGQELAVLRDFPFHKFLIKVIIMEVKFYKKKQMNELNDLLNRYNYVLVKKLKYDNIYVHKSVHDPKAM